MWYTIPSDKNEQKKCIEALNNYIQDAEMSEEIDFREDLLELTEVYSGERPFNAESAYEKLYNIYSELELTNGESKEKLFGKDTSLEAFKKNFLETWKNLSLCMLIDDKQLYRNDARDQYLNVYEQLHDHHKMTDDNIKTVAQKMHFLESDFRDRDLQNNITNLEEFLGNGVNSLEIVKGIKDRQFSKNKYLTNRLQLLEQFANGDATDMKAYMPFYGRAEQIKAGKKVSAGEAKKAEEAMKDGSLDNLRKEVRNAWENRKPDPNLDEFLKVQQENYNALNDAMSDVNQSLSREEKEKTKLRNHVDAAYAKAKETMGEQLQPQIAEFDKSLKKNQELLQNIEAKILANPEITEYEEAWTPMLHRFEEEIKNQEAKEPLSALSELHEEAVADYNAAHDRYQDKLQKKYNELKQKHREAREEDSPYYQKEKELDNKESELGKQIRNLNLLSKDQLEQHIKENKKLCQDFQQLHKNEIPKLTVRQKKIDALIANVHQEIAQAANDLNAAKEKIAATVVPEQLKSTIQERTNTLNAFHERYSTYFRDVEKRYEEAVQNRNNLKEVFEAAQDITKKKGFFSIQKKNPKIFTDTMDAVETYMGDRRNPEKAQAAYDACRSYVERYMKSDRSGLKSGNKDGNTRRQTVVRMLELMDQLPEFQKLTVSADKNKDGWEIVDADEKEKPKYEKLNFQQLEASLAKHATKQKKSGKHAKKQEKALPFNDLNKLVNKRKEQKGREV